MARKKNSKNASDADKQAEDTIEAAKNDELIALEDAAETAEATDVASDDALAETAIETADDDAMVLQEPEEVQELEEVIPDDKPLSAEEPDALDELAADMESIEGAEVVSEAGEGQDEADAPSEDAVDTTEMIEDPAVSEPESPSPAPHKTVQSSGGFLPLVAGGIVAAGIGYFMAEHVIPEGWPSNMPPDTSAFETETRAALEAQSGVIADLEARLSDASASQSATIEGIAALQNEVANIGDNEALTAALADISGRLDGFEERLSDLEKRPVTDAVSTEAIAAYERELAALQESVTAQRAEIENIAAEAVNKEAEANAMAQATLARAALTRVVGAIESGAPFAGALAEFESAGGTDIPGGLVSVAESGVPSLASLQDAFPDVARAALAASRAGDGESAGGLGNFMARQLGARSVTPREGNDPDAVLSRAEAAVREGRLTDALAEIETLPEAGRAQTTAWVEQAGLRRDALAAAQALEQRFGEN